MYLGMSKKSFKCPRCGGENIVEYKESFDCVDCGLEFEKRDVLACKTKEDLANVMAIEEKSNFLRAFKDDDDSDADYNKKLKKFFED